MLRVFISYATRSAEAGDTIAALEAGATAAGLAIDWFQDARKIRMGEEWARAIDSALHDCHAAVLLLCPAAVDSWWVRKEVIVFLHRMVTEPDFLFLPILLDDTLDEQFRVRPDWRPTDVTRLQLRKGEAPADRARALADVVALLAAHGAAIAPTPLGLLRGDLRVAIAGIGNRARVRTALDAMSERPGAPALPDEQLAGALADALLGGDPDGVASALRELADSDAAVVKQLLGAFPFTWVHGDAAVRLIPRIDKQPPEPPRVTLPGIVVLPSVLEGPEPLEVDPRVVAWSWLVRGSCRTRRAEVLTVSGQSHGSFDAVLDEITRALRTLPGAGAVTEPWLRGRWGRNAWTVVVVSLPRVELNEIRALIQRFPSVLIFVLVPPGTAIPEDPSVYTPRPWTRDGATDPDTFERHALGVWAELADLAGIPPAYPPP